jgi:hypothetical protein
LNSQKFNESRNEISEIRLSGVIEKMVKTHQMKGAKGATPSTTKARLVGAVLVQSTVGTFCPAAQKGILPKLYLFDWCANNNQHPKDQY